jgi:hypothetical protein
VIKPTVVVALVLLGISHLAEAQYDARDADVIDLLKPQGGAGGTKRRCTVEVDQANIPCSGAWYIQFKDGSRAVQFNQAMEGTPMVSLFGTENAPNKLSVENVVLRLGGRSNPGIEREAVGECFLTNEEIHCDVKTSDNRHIAAHILPP